jgi:hypothetical protein
MVVEVFRAGPEQTTRCDDEAGLQEVNQTSHSSRRPLILTGRRPIPRLPIRGFPFSYYPAVRTFEADLQAGVAASRPRARIGEEINRNAG